MCQEYYSSLHVLQLTDSLYVILGGGDGLVTKLCLTLATPWTVAFQASLSMEFPRQEYQSVLPFSSPEIFLAQGSNLGPLHCRRIPYQLYCRQIPYQLSQHGSPSNS